MKWCKAAWSAITAESIANCWRHTGLLTDDVSTIQNPLVGDVTDDTLLESMKQLKIVDPLTLEEMADHESQFELHHTFSEIELMNLFCEVQEDSPETSDDEVDDGPSLDEKIRALRTTTLTILFDNPIENEVAVRQVRRILMELNLQKTENQ